MAILIDSSLSQKDALKQNPKMICPQEIINRQRIIEVTYYSFDNKLHQGQIIIDKDLISDIQRAFELIKQEKFSITSVIPISDERFQWDDEKSMEMNNSVGFNYRTIVGKSKLSNHSFGKAIDINPLLNPYIRNDGMWPKGVTYDINKKGTIKVGDKLTLYFKSRGWVWGGDWTDRKDFKHFEKP